MGPQGRGGAGPGGGGGRASGLVAGMGHTGGNGGTAAGRAHLLPGPGLLPVPLPVLDPVPVPVLDPLPAPLPVPSRSCSRCRSRPGPLSPAGSGAEAPAPPPREFPSLTDRRLSQSERAAAYKRGGLWRRRAVRAVMAAGAVLRGGGLCDLSLFFIFFKLLLLFS